MTDSDVNAKQLVLLVDDNEQTSYVIQSMLELMDFEVELANNGRVAVEMCSATDYAVILMDIEMPEMDGLAATKAIRTNESTGLAPPVPIVGITGHTDAGTRVLCERAGMTDVLLKPFLMVQLEEKLKSVYETRLN